MAAAQQREVSLQVEVPAAVKKQLHLKAALEGVTLRTLVLQALCREGIRISEQDMLDRRKKK